MEKKHPRLIREQNTIRAMIAIYCNAKHGTKDALCNECEELVLYSKLRLDLCPFQEEKPTCGNCTIHCYKLAMRKKAQQVMRFSGPRMTWCHPILAIYHFIDRFRNPQHVKRKEK